MPLSKCSGECALFFPTPRGLFINSSCTFSCRLLLMYSCLNYSHVLMYLCLCMFPAGQCAFVYFMTTSYCLYAVVYFMTFHPFLFVLTDVMLCRYQCAVLLLPACPSHVSLPILCTTAVTYDLLHPFTTSPGLCHVQMLFPMCLAPFCWCPWLSHAQRLLPCTLSHMPLLMVLVYIMSKYSF